MAIVGQSRRGMNYVCWRLAVVVDEAANKRRQCRSLCAPVLQQLQQLELLCQPMRSKARASQRERRSARSVVKYSAGLLLLLLQLGHGQKTITAPSFTSIALSLPLSLTDSLLDQSTLF